ncbi:MAG: hypothetical protein JNL44_15570 [Gemmatimonadetes bacterium]|nr:hypothetical protein [Gemmatimonadota bacterium]
MPLHEKGGATRREFFDRVGMLSLAVAAPLVLGVEEALAAPTPRVSAADYDLSWIALLSNASDRGLVDTTQASRFSLQIATRYLDNCDAAYGKDRHSARLVLNLRTRAVPLALKDELWERFELGADSDIKDASGAHARTNPFLNRPPGMIREEGSIQELVDRGSIVLVCDFALGHMANRVAAKRGTTSDVIHRDILDGLLPGVFAVPSGIFGAIRAQNAGCGWVGGV